MYQRHATLIPKLPDQSGKALGTALTMSVSVMTHRPLHCTATDHHEFHSLGSRPLLGIVQCTTCAAVRSHLINVVIHNHNISQGVSNGKEE
jgi:hypothetical protein